jgi:hypothetical protein
VKSVVDCGLSYLKALWQLPIIGFEGGSLVRFLPNIVASHGDSSLAQMRSKGKRIFALASSRIRSVESGRSGSLRR